MQIDSSSGDDFAGSAKIVISYFWIYLIAFMLLLHLIETCLDIFPVLTCCNSFCEFITRNMRESGVNKKCVRFFDTLGSIAALIALVIGLTSLFVDKYDLNFLPEGFLKDLVDVGKEFQKALDPVAR